jgi:hypothetical protein
MAGACHFEAGAGTQRPRYCDAPGLQHCLCATLDENVPRDAFVRVGPQDARRKAAKGAAKLEARILEWSRCGPSAPAGEGIRF